MKKLKILDFDDTIFSREQQLSEEKLLRENRWAEWIKVILEEFWIDNFIEKYYKGKDFPKDLFQEDDETDIVIITAGHPKIQLAKIQATWLNSFPVRITYSGAEKPLALQNYIQENKLSPELIEVYEDRPEYFIDARESLEKNTWAKLRIYKVEMDWNDWYKSIEEV